MWVWFISMNQFKLSISINWFKMKVNHLYYHFKKVSLFIYIYIYIYLIQYFIICRHSRGNIFCAGGLRNKSGGGGGGGVGHVTRVMRDARRIRREAALHRMITVSKYRESDKKAVRSYAFESLSRYFDVIRWSFCTASIRTRLLWSKSATFVNKSLISSFNISEFVFIVAVFSLKKIFNK